MDKDISPEEKLFNAVKGDKTKSVPPVPEIKSPTEKTALWKKMFGSPALKMSSAGKPLLSAVPSSQLPGIDLKRLNFLLVVVLVFLGLWLGYKISYERQAAAKLNISAPKGDVPAFVYSEGIEAFKPLEDYLGEIQKKDIFHPFAKTPEPAPVVEEVKPVQAGPSIKDLMKNLSLAGIYEGKDMEAMIEDKELKKTYFVKQGDEVKGMKVKEILQDRVVLQLGDEEQDLL